MSHYSTAPGKRLLCGGSGGLRAWRGGLGAASSCSGGAGGTSGAQRVWEAVGRPLQKFVEKSDEVRGGGSCCWAPEQATRGKGELPASSEGAATAWNAEQASAEAAVAGEEGARGGAQKAV